MDSTVPTQLIAEIGANHMGDIRLAEEMIQAAAESGADIVKFQSFRADDLVHDYPEYATNYNYYKSHELSDDDHHRLIATCTRHGVKFLTTCFSITRIKFLASLPISTIKVASSDLTSARMLTTLKRYFSHIIVSTGMSRPEEIAATARLLNGHTYTFMHCISLYPTPLANVRMANLQTLRQFTPSVGFSDHTMGTDAAKLAVALGATYIEKHFTIDRNLPGRDQQISALPHEIREIADYITQVRVMMGAPNDTAPLPDEIAMRKRYIGRWGDNR